MTYRLGRLIGINPAERTPNRATRRYLARRDQGCTHPLCTQKLWLHAHHITHWTDDGPTSPENLTLLCPTPPPRPPPRPLPHRRRPRSANTPLPRPVRATNRPTRPRPTPTRPATRQRSPRRRATAPVALHTAVRGTPHRRHLRLELRGPAPTQARPPVRGGPEAYHAGRWRHLAPRSAGAPAWSRSPPTTGTGTPPTRARSNRQVRTTRTRRRPATIRSTASGCPTSTSGAAREHMRELARHALRTRSTASWHRVEWEGLEKIPTDGGALLVSQPRRRHPGRRPGDHARHRGGARPARVRPGRRDLQDDAGGRHAVVPRSAACSPTPTTPTACSASRSSSPWCSPRAPRAPARSTASATSCAASGGAASCRSPCAPGCRWCRSRWSAPRRRCRSSSRSTALAKALGVPYVPITANMLAFGPIGMWMPFPAKIKIRVLDPVPFDVEPDQPRYSRSLIMDESERIRQQIQEALYDMLRQPAQSSWFGLPWASASSSPGSARSGAAGWPRPSRPTPPSTSSSASTATSPPSRWSAPSTCAPTRATRSSPAS